MAANSIETGTTGQFTGGGAGRVLTDAQAKVVEQNANNAMMLERAREIAYAPGDATEADWKGIDPWARAQATQEDLQTSARRASDNFTGNMLPLMMLGGAFAAPMLGIGAGAGTAAAGAGGADVAGLAALDSAAAAGGASAGGASGLAGYLGLSPGAGATALNAGALNGGMTALRGGNLSDALKSGLMGAAFSPITGYVSNTVGGGALGSIAGNAASGGIRAGLTGSDILGGWEQGAVNGGVGYLGSQLGDAAKDAASDAGASDAVAKTAGAAASSATQSTLKGKKNGLTNAGVAALLGLANPFSRT